MLTPRRRDVFPHPSTRAALRLTSAAVAENFFLTERADRDAYVAQVERAVRPGGHVLVATIAEDGPTQCSGLPVARYSAAGLHGAFGSAFDLLSSEREEHVTPAGAHQSFGYCLCRRA